MRLTFPHILHARQVIRVSLILLVIASVPLGGQPLRIGLEDRSRSR